MPASHCISGSWRHAKIVVFLRIRLSYVLDLLQRIFIVWSLACENVLVILGRHVYLLLLNEPLSHAHPT